MANYWYGYWNRYLHAMVLPALRGLYEFQERQVVPAMGLRREHAVPPEAELPGQQRPTSVYSDSSAVVEQLREDASLERGEQTQALAVYTSATCQALYLEASRFLLLLYHKEIAFTNGNGHAPVPPFGDLSELFAERRVPLKQLEGFEAYDLLRVIAQYHGDPSGHLGGELRRGRPGWVSRRPASCTDVLIEPTEVKWLHEGLCRFLGQAVEILQQ